MYFYLFVFYLCILINNYIKYLLHKCKSGASHFSLHYFLKVVTTESCLCEAAVHGSRVSHVLLPD